MQLEYTGRRRFLLLFTTALATACSSSDGLGDASNNAVTDGVSGQALMCQRTEYFEGGAVKKYDEVYDATKINAQLAADPVLKTFVGIEKVSSCDDAQQFAKKTMEFEATLPSVNETVGSTVSSNDDVVEKIYKGVAGAQRAVVWLPMLGCTGTLIGPQVLLTAAHCIPRSNLFGDMDGDGINDYGVVQVGPTYLNPDDQKTYCLTRNPGPGISFVGTCQNTVNDSPQQSVAVNPKYFVTPGFDEDLALIVFDNRPWNAPANTSAHWAGLQTTGMATGQKFLSTGRGDNDYDCSQEVVGPNAGFECKGLGYGVQRFDADNANVDQVTGTVIESDAKDSGGVRICEGDSGGPAMTTTSTRILLGVLSRWYNPSHTGTSRDPLPPCAEKGNGQWWTRVGPKVNWINSVLTQWSISPRCTRALTQAEAPHYNFRECF